MKHEDGSPFYGFTAADIRGKQRSMREFAGKVVLVVNTASKCGFTPQYAGLQELYGDLAPRGLEILGFPCNQFGAQEPGAGDEIMEFCRLNYGVTFPMFGKIEVNGDAAHPLYVYLKETLPGEKGPEIPWNFTKFLIGRDGVPLKRFDPSATPVELGREIGSLLGL